jgi:hypothetical protein
MDSQDILVTYHLNTFNRLENLRNLLLSFELCNVHENFEWVITDYGSSDGTKDFLYDYSKVNKNISLIFGNEKKYLEKLKKLSLEPKSRNQMIGAIFGKAINEARSISNGDYYIHIADDHQFFRKGDWVSEMVDILEHRRKKVNYPDVSSILYRSLPLYRLHKENNERFPVETTNSQVLYYVAKHKRYDDYHFMTKNCYQKLGKFFEIHEEERSDIVSNWKNPEGKVFNHYIDYLDRTKKMDYYKIFMKYPWVVDLDGKVNKAPNSNFPVRITDSEEFKSSFQHLNRPVSSNEIFSYSTRRR